MCAMYTRRELLAFLAIAPFAAASARPAAAAAVRVGPGARPPHPEPRPGITAEKVVADDQLAVATPSVLAAFAAVRQIPQVVDGIRCHCGCAEIEGNYSLLSCYEAGGMAQHCQICQGQARMALRLHEDGRTLDQIRSATDARYG